MGAWRDGASAGGTVIAIRTPVRSCSAAVTTLPHCGTSGYRPGTGRATGRRCSGPPRDWAGARRALWLKIETQNVNVPACQFYQKMGSPWAPSTGSPIPGCQARCGCCGGRPWHRPTRTPADLTSALNHKLVPLPHRPAHRRPIRVGFKAYAAHAEMSASSLFQSVLYMM